MKSKRKHFLALSLAGIGAIGAFASVSAASLQAGTPTRARDEVRTAIKQAFTVGDYQAYLATTKDYKVGVPILTEAQFNTVIQANKLRMSGDIAGAKKLLDDAGIKPQSHNNKNKRGGAGLKQNLTDAQKTTMKQAREFMKAGKQDEAKALLTSAGITLPAHRGGMHATQKNQQL